MSLMQLKTILLVGALVLVAVPSASGSSLLVNGGAESGLSGWEGAGFGVLVDQEGMAVSRSPLALGGPHPIGTPLFAAPQDASISQVVDVSTAVGRGEQAFTFGGLMGGRGGLPGGARLVVQALDAAGAALGEPVIAGPPSDRDRQHTTMLLACEWVATTPIGTSAMRVSLQAIGHGLADDLYLKAGRVPPPAILIPSPPETASVPSDGPGCQPHLEPIVVPNVMPKASVQLYGTALRADKRGRFKIVVACASGLTACEATLKVSRSGHAIERRSLTVKAGKRRAVTITADQALRRALARGAKVRLRVSLIVGTSTTTPHRVRSVTVSGRP